MSAISLATVRAIICSSIKELYSNFQKISSSRKPFSPQLGVEIVGKNGRPIKSLKFNY